jgi:hypothetical protein
MACRPLKKLPPPQEKLETIRLSAMSRRQSTLRKSHDRLKDAIQRLQALSSLEVCRKRLFARLYCVSCVLWSLFNHLAVDSQSFNEQRSLFEIGGVLSPHPISSLSLLLFLLLFPIFLLPLLFFQIHLPMQKSKKHFPFQMRKMISSVRLLSLFLRLFLIGNSVSQ